MHSLESRIRQYFSGLDALDVDTVARFFAEGAKVRLGNSPPLVGKREIRRALIHLATRIHSIHHKLVTLWMSGGLLSVIEADVTFICEDGSPVTIPVTYILRWADDLIVEGQAWMYSEPQVTMALEAWAA